MHVFITGAVQCGKSTVLARAVAESGLAAAGFETFFGGDRALSDKVLHMGAYGGGRQATDANAVVRFEAGVPRVLTGLFDGIGRALLEKAREAARLIVMDECGRFEREAYGFQRAIFDALDGDIPVLGVVRQGAGGWTEEILSHPKVRLLVVTEANRDGMPEEILCALGVC